MANDAEAELIEEMARFTHDSRGFARFSYSWGESELDGEDGPREWQDEVLGAIDEHLQNTETRFMPLLLGVASGHGIGKSALISIIVNWGLSTCEDCKVVITANTETQLRTKTWPELTTWTRRSMALKPATAPASVIVPVPMLVVVSFTRSARTRAIVDPKQYG